MVTTGWRQTFVLIACALASCGPKAGEDPTTASDTTAADAGTLGGSGEVTGSVDVGIVGTWVGYVDAGAAVPSGSDHVDLTIAAVDADGQITGTVSFGEAGTLPPATDPDVGYPSTLGGGPPSSTVFDGFTYSLTGSYDATQARLQVQLLAAELWTDWCALQTSYPTSEDAYGCLPNCGYTGGDVDCSIPDDCAYVPGPVDCGKLALCTLDSVCTCNADGCVHEDSGAIAFDMHRDGDALQGPSDLLGTAFLIRQ